MALPRMRNIDAAIKEIKAEDPNTALTTTQLRYMVKSGKIPSVKVGHNRTLVNLDLLIEYLSSDAYQLGEDQPTQRGQIRRVEA